MNTIAERIKFAMNVRNVKQVEMVQKTGITKGAFSSYLSGNYNPKKDKLELIADAKAVIWYQCMIRQWILCPFDTETKYFLA